MELTREQKRLLMLHEYKLSEKPNATATARRINQAWGERTVGERTVQERFAEFRAGNEDITHQQGAGRPREVDRQAVIDKIEANPSMTSRMLADEFECTNPTILNILNEAGKHAFKPLSPITLGLKSLKCKWVPHELTETQKQKRVDVCARLLKRYEEDDSLLNDIVTCDEKWVAFDNPHQGREWRYPDQPASATPVKDFRNAKRMLIVFWNREGIIHYELLPKGATMNAERYCEILRRLHKRIRNGQRVILQHDNAKPHTAKLTKKLLLNEFGWDVLEHPPYSPDLAPSDYHLFRSMEHSLRNTKFKTSVELENALINFFNSKGANFYRRGIDLLPGKWQETIDVDGEYFDY